MKSILVSLLGMMLIAILFAACQEDHRNASHKNVPLSSIRSGKALAIQYCQSCHLLPDPSLLDSKSWENGVLPVMGPRLGIFAYGTREYPSARNDRNIGPNFYPHQPQLSFPDWQNIIDYYTATSPDSLPAQHRTAAIDMNLPTFKVLEPRTFYRAPATVFTKINAADSLSPLIVNDAIRKTMYFFDRSLQLRDSVHTTGAVVDMALTPDGMLACDIGVLNPNNGKFGSARMIRKPFGKLMEDSVAIFDSLRRPVQITPADFNNDGKTDYLVCEFGNLIGELSWMENLGGNKFNRHVLRGTPGAIKAYITDYNRDGLPDIWVLFAQADEGIMLFTNKGHGEFSAEQILRFPPSYGSSYFELADFDHDGYPDILYTCGDNADFSPVLKPYHGVYIFMNDKSNHFTQKFFFPIDGCYKAIARDFDNDGDLDIATISFFADYQHQPQEGFVYLENEGNFDFRPFGSKEAEKGRWLTIDAGDINGDGKIDLMLGNFSLGGSVTPSKIDWKQSPPFIVLMNTSGPKH